MSKKSTWIALATTALATLFIASSSLEPAAARDGRSSSSYSGGGKFSGGGVRAYSGGQRFYGGGTGQYSRSYKSPSLGSSRLYAYKSPNGYHRHHRHFRGRTFVYGYPYVDSYYYYGYSDSCYWLRRRALATGSSYWWNRYYDCINDY